MIGALVRSVVVILTAQFGAAMLNVNHSAVFVTSLVVCAAVEMIAFVIGRQKEK